MNIFKRKIDNLKNLDCPNFLSYYSKNNKKPKLLSAKLFYKTIFYKSNLLTKKIKSNKIAIVSSNNYDYLICLSSLLYLGKKILIIREEEIDEIKISSLIKCSVKYVVFTSLKEMNKKVYSNFKKILFSKIGFKNNNYKNQNIAPSIIFLSSGTTTDPKMIEIKQNNIISQLYQIDDRLEIKKKENLFTTMPCNHVSGLFFVFFNGIFFQKKIFISNYFSINFFIETINKRNIDFCFINPSILSTIVEFISYKLNNSKKLDILCGSAPLSKTHLKKFINIINCNFNQCYGLTETSNTLICMPSAMDNELKKKLYFNQKIPSIGQSLKNCEIKILIKNKFCNEQKIIGEIIATGPNIVNQENTLHKNFFYKKKWLRTGDLGYFIIIKNRKYYFISGRLKEMIKKKSMNIFPNQIDEYLKKHNLFNIYTFSLPDKMFGEEIHLATDQKDIKLNRLKKICNKIPTYQRPKKLFFVTKIPKTISKKIKRNLIHKYLIHKKSVLI